MLSFLKNHPFAVEAFFSSTIVLTYAIPAQQLTALLPQCLELDTWDGKWGFVAVAVVTAHHLRPQGFPMFMGNDFVLVGYRIFVRYTDSRGKRLRGLYIVQSETNKHKMALLGNLFTHYNYTTTDISVKTEGSMISIQSAKSALTVVADASNEQASLPTDSPFPSWKEARRFTGPMPFTFGYNETSHKVLIVEGVREDWTPRPISILKADVGFTNKMQLHGAVLANAFMIRDVPYHWKKGRTELWQKT